MSKFKGMAYMQKGNNLQDARISSDTRDLITTAFELYNIAKLDYNIYRKDLDLSIPKNLIIQYYKKVKPNYNNMIFSFKRKYISNEALVEKNDTPEERKGLALVYDYIQNFDIENDEFNIFITSLIIHKLLYKPLDDKTKEEKEEMLLYGLQLKDEASSEKNLEKLNNAKEIILLSSGSSFGGQLRTGPVTMKGFDIEIPSSEEAMKLFNQYLNPEKKKEYENVLNSSNIFEYINYAIKTTTDLIGTQPFADGNKRTFRSLLNLMFKKKNLPPVYIVKKERKAYHDALEKAICEHDYSTLEAFYYYKICDSIYELEFEPYLREIEANKSK